MIHTRRYPRLIQPFASRPHLMAAILLGVVLYFAVAPWAERTVTRALIGWDGGILLFLGLSFFFMRDCNLERMKQRAIDHDEGGHLLLLLTIFAAIASVAALFAELSQAKGQPGAGYHVALAAATVILSWLFVQVAFALHYAHVYYLSRDADRHQGGLDFGYGEEEPDYWDFVHFAIVIGATSQTADIVFKSRQMRRVSTLHSVVAFAFNTAILATMINLAANLF